MTASARCLTSRCVFSFLMHTDVGLCADGCVSYLHLCARLCRPWCHPVLFSPPLCLSALAAHVGPPLHRQGLRPKHHHTRIMPEATRTERYFFVVRSFWGLSTRPMHWHPLCAVLSSCILPRTGNTKFVLSRLPPSTVSGTPLRSKHGHP